MDDIEHIRNVLAVMGYKLYVHDAYDHKFKEYVVVDSENRNICRVYYHNLWLEKDIHSLNGDLYTQLINAIERVQS
jgi:hypothetical protein